MRLTLAQLAEQSGLPERSIRFYIQKGLVDRPEGEKRGAYYTAVHLEQSQRIRQWREAGLSLEAIAALLRRGSATAVEAVPAFEVRTHFQIAPGVELVVAPERAGLDGEQVRELWRAVQAAAAALGRTGHEEGGDDDGPG